MLKIILEGGAASGKTLMREAIEAHFGAGVMVVEVGGHRLPEFKIEERSDFDYMAEADKTCSVHFKPDQVQRTYFIAVLQSIVDGCEELNIAKKLLFRGKTPEELGRVYPLTENSLAMDFPENVAPADIDLLHGIVGVITEAGEMAELLLKRLSTGEFDRVNAFEEVGDVSWYLARQLRGLNADFDMSNRANIDKLHGRHGEAFDVFRDANRDLGEERKRLEVAATPLFDPVTAMMKREAAHAEDMLDGDLAADAGVAAELQRRAGMARAGVAQAQGGRVLNDPPYADRAERYGAERDA